MVYKKGTLDIIQVDGGYIKDGQYYFYLQDHLGSNRVVADANGNVVQTNHYYPYGTPFAEGYNQDVQKYKYIGKEYDMENGLNYYDVKARLLDGPRFTTMDLLSEKYYSWSPYSYSFCNPIRFFDPNGWEPQIPPTIPLPTPIPPISVFTPQPLPNLPSETEVKRAVNGAVIKQVSDIKSIGMVFYLMVKGMQAQLADNTNVETVEAGKTETKQVDEASHRKGDAARAARKAGKEAREKEPASEKRAKDLAKDLERKRGKDARRKAHDSKDKIGRDRTLKELKEDYNPNKY
jgi:RHS repeat-associated protein